MRRLYLQFYLTIIAILVIFALAAAMVWHFTRADDYFGERFDVVSELVSKALPPADAPHAIQQRAIEDFQQRLHVGLVLYAADGTLLAQAGRAFPPLNVD